MNQIVQLQRENKDLMEHLQDAVALATNFKREMGITHQEELARLNAKANGVRFNSREFDMSDKNGEQ